MKKFFKGLMWVLLAGAILFTFTVCLLELAQYDDCENVTSRECFQRRGGVWRHAPDGRLVPCIRGNGGLSCDWDYGKGRP